MMLHMSILSFQMSLWKVLIRLFVFIFIIMEITAVNADEDTTTDALYIESETTLQSAKYNRGESELSSKSDKERRTIGIGETVTLTAGGKPLGNIAELTWNITSGNEAIKVSTDSDSNELKGETLILTAKKSLKQDADVTVTFVTSEGRSPKETCQLKVVIPSEKKIEHINGGTPTNNPMVDLINNRGIGLIPSMRLKITLHPLEVNFGNIQVVERDEGSEPEGCSLDPGHKGNGVDELVEINDQNAFADNISGGIENYSSLKQYGGKNELPQTWEWVSRWYVHDCEETNCPGDSSPEEGRSNKDDLPTPSEPHSTIGDSADLKESRTKFILGYKKNAQGENNKIYVEISKFGFTVSRIQDESQNDYH